MCTHNKTNNGRNQTYELQIRMMIIMQALLCIRVTTCLSGNVYTHHARQHIPPRVAAIHEHNPTPCFTIQSRTLAISSGHSRVFRRMQRDTPRVQSWCLRNHLDKPRHMNPQLRPCTLAAIHCVCCTSCWNCVCYSPLGLAQCLTHPRVGVQ